jgi:Methyltransferase domain/Glycosyl transferase family 2
MMPKTLEEFYHTTVSVNDSFTGGWAPYYYGVMTNVINDNNYKIVAEVGVGYGTHAKFLLKTTMVDRLYLIDPMQYYADDGFAKSIMECKPKIRGNNFNELYDLVCQELSPWKDRYTWFRVPSQAITNEHIADGSLDCVFLDADTTFESVLEDLEFWWGKLRVGGQLLGDDYWIGDVSRAVHEFANKNNLVPEFLTKPNTNYQIYSFKKVPNAVVPETLKVSLCIPTMNRWDFLKINIPKYLDNPYIAEIIICDENGHDAAHIRHFFNDPKICTVVNEQQLGPFLNKRKVVSLAKQPFVCLMDSDNFASVSYFHAWAKYLDGKAPDERTIYSPVRTIPQANHPGFDFTILRGAKITPKNFKHFWRATGPECAETLYNVGNYIVSKKLFDTTRTIPELRYFETQKGPDVMFQNYMMWATNNMTMVIVPHMEYQHIVHEGSYYTTHKETMNIDFYNSLYKI